MEQLLNIYLLNQLVNSQTSIPATIIIYIPSAHSGAEGLSAALARGKLMHCRELRAFILLVNTK